MLTVFGIGTALPLFNVTRTFVAQLELFRACGYRPTADHPSISAWIASGSPAAMLSAAARVSGGSSGGAAAVPRVSHRARWKCESDAEGEDGRGGERDLRRKIGTPARCGSFSIPGPSSLTSTSATKSTSSSSASTSASTTKTPQIGGAVAGPGGEGAGNVDDDIDALLTRCAGVGDPGFVFDVEAFRSALRGISVSAGNGGNETVVVAEPGAGAKRKGGAG